MLCGRVASSDCPVRHDHDLICVNTTSSWDSKPYTFDVDVNLVCSNQNLSHLNRSPPFEHSNDWHMKIKTYRDWILSINWTLSNVGCKLDSIHLKSSSSCDREWRCIFAWYQCVVIKLSSLKAEDDDQMSQEVKICTTKRSGIDY